MCRVVTIKTKSAFSLPFILSHIRLRRLRYMIHSPEVPRQVRIPRSVRQSLEQMESMKDQFNLIKHIPLITRSIPLSVKSRKLSKSYRSNQPVHHYRPIKTHPLKRTNKLMLFWLKSVNGRHRMLQRFSLVEASRTKHLISYVTK
jgi:hypothetical protein